MIDKECIHWKVCKPISGYFNVKLECKDCPNRDDEWITLANQMKETIQELQAEIERLKEGRYEKSHLGVVCGRANVSVAEERKGR